MAEEFPRAKSQFSLVEVFFSKGNKYLRDNMDQVVQTQSIFSLLLIFSLRKDNSKGALPGRQSKKANF